MTYLLNYAIEANLCLLFFLILYVLFLQKETDFSFSRYYIIAALIFSILFPLFHVVSNPSASILPSVGKSIPTYWLPEFVLGGVNPATSETSLGMLIWNGMVWIYFLGIASFSLLLIFRLCEITHLMKKIPCLQWKNCSVAKTNENIPTFSFFNFILIGQVNKLTDEEVVEILRHEYVHVKKLHSIDILLVNLIGILFWFNPLIRTYKKILTELHEFEADARAVENHDLGVYCNLLARVALQSADFSIANHFNKSLTVKRITMIKTEKNKIEKWKLAAIAVAVPAIFFFVACQDQVMEDVGQRMENSSIAVEYPAEVQQELDKLQASNTQSSFHVLQLDENIKRNIEGLEKKYGLNNVGVTFFENSSPIHEKSDSSAEIEYDLSKISDGQELFVILELNKDINKNSGSGTAASRKEIFTVAEQQPLPKEGMEHFYRYIGENMQYPSEAQKKGVEGKVFVQFIVNEDGSISDVKALKGIGGGCDAEAVRVISQSESWHAGLQHGEPVNVKMIMPITFALN